MWGARASTGGGGKVCPGIRERIGMKDEEE